MNWALFGDRVFADISKFKMRSSWDRVGPNPMSGVLLIVKSGQRYTEGRWPCEDKGTSGLTASGKASSSFWIAG